MDRLPVYEARLNNEETGVYAISLVDLPAVETNWQFFNEQKPMQFAIQDEEKRIIRGVIMECNKLIYRRDPSGYEYLITFSEETIRQMAQKFLSDGMQTNVDTMHNGNMVEGVELVQWFISDKTNGINPKGFETVNDHSLFAEYKVENDLIWSEVKNGTFKGFSLAGIFDTVQVHLQRQETLLDEIEGLIKKISEKINK